MKLHHQTKPIILLAEGDSQSRKTLCLQLADEYSLLEAENTLQAIHILEGGEQVDALIYNPNLPGLTAKEFLAFRKEHALLRRIPTGIFADPNKGPHFSEDSLTTTLPLPPDPNTLKEWLHRAICGHTMSIPAHKVLDDAKPWWKINACEIQRGFALYRYTEEQSCPIYVDSGFLAIAEVDTMEEFTKKYPDISAFTQGQSLDSFDENVRIAMRDHTSFSFSIEMRSREHFGAEYFFYASWIPYPTIEEPVFIVMVLDSSQIMENQKNLFSLIEQDPLTGIYNQETFFRKTAALLHSDPDTPYLFIRWNIERFKTVNELFGTSTGNAILVALGKTFTKIIGKSGTYGRLYSDQFALCIPAKGFDPKRFAQLVETELNANTLYAYIRSVFGIYEIVDPTMGVSLMSDRANMALNTAKGNYQRPFAYYTEPLRKRLLKEQAIVNEMRKALDLGQFQIFLQPFFSITENRFTGAEALVRWVHPERGIIGPDTFIPIFEENGFIIPLDDYIIEQVCILQRRILDEGRPTVPIAVNLSRADFYNQDIAKNIMEKTERYAIPHSLLMFEITESVYSENPEELLKVMRTLQGAGFLILMDDFGSGYSSLNILKDVPIDILKLDSMFSKEIGTSSRAEKIIRSIVHMASLLDLPLIIEGIETQEQVDFYKLLGCNTLQGFYFSKALPIEQFLCLDMVHHRPAFITDKLFQHMGSFALSEVQSNILRTLFDEIYLFNYTDDRYQQLYSSPRTPSPSFPSQGSLSSFLEGVRTTRILPQDRAQFARFFHTSALSSKSAIKKQRFSWIDTKGDDKEGSITLISLESTGEKHLALCCTSSESSTCKSGGEECLYKSRYAIIEQLANLKVMEWDIEQDTLYRSPNLALLQLGKIGPKALVAREYPTSFIHEDDLPLFEKCITEVLTGPKQRGTSVRLQLLNGALRWYNIQIYVTRNSTGEPKRVIASLLDIDSKMRLSEQLRTATREIDFLTSAAPWGVVMGHLSSEGEIVTTFHNPIFYKLLGYTHHEFNALGIDYYSMIKEGGDKLITHMYKKQNFSLTLQIQQKDGSLLPVEISVLFSPLEQYSREFVCYIFEQE